MKVTEWPSYLLWNVPDHLRILIAEEAAERKATLADVIRQILCDRYQLDCPPMSRGRRSKPSRNAHFLLRVQPELFAAVQADAETRDVSVRHLILTTLNEHFGEEEAA